MSPQHAPQPNHHLPHTTTNVNPITPALAWNAFCRWWKWIIPLGILIAAVPAYVLYSQFEPQYRASAVLLIHDRIQGIVSAPDLSPRFAQNQVELIRSAPVLDPVAADPEIARIPEIANSQDPRSVLLSGLRINNIGGSEMFNLSFTCGSGQDAAKIVNKIAASYLKVQSGDQRRRTDDVMTYLQQEKTTRALEMKRLRDNVRELAKQVTGKDPFSIDTPGKAEAPATFLGLQAEVARMDVSQSILQEQISELRSKVQTASELPINDAEIDQRIDESVELKTLNERLKTQMAVMAEHEAKSADIGSNRGYQRVKTEVAGLHEEIKQLRVTLQEPTRQALQTEKLKEQKLELATLEKQFASNAISHRVYKERLKSELASAKQYAGDALELDFARTELEQATGIYDQLSNNLVLLQTGKGEPDRVRLWQEAKAPTAPTELLPWKKIGIVAAAAFCIPFGLALAWEWLARRISDRHQIESQMQLRVVGEVARLPKTVRDSRNTRVQLFEESVDSLRTNLLMGEAAHDVRVISVTSATSKEGKTSLSTQLAVSIAIASGKPTLLIDGDMRAPDIHEIFDGPLGPGLAEVLEGKATSEEAIATHYGEFLHIMPAGKLRASPHALVGSGRFDRMIEQLREQYTYIIVDTPPVLAAGESLVMSSCTDASVVCAMQGKSRMDQVKMVCQLLASVGANCAGVVLNGVPLGTYSYYYGRYDYVRGLNAPADA